MRGRAFKSDPRNGRVADLRQRSPSQRNRNARRRGFHQDFNGENFTRRDHAGNVGNAGSNSRLFLRERDSDWDETSWRNSHGQGSAGLLGDGEGNVGGRLAHLRSFSLWRQHPAQRRSHAIGKSGRRQLPECGLFFLTLILCRDGNQTARSSRLSIETARPTGDQSQKDVWISASVGDTRQLRNRTVTLNCATAITFSSMAGSRRPRPAIVLIPLTRLRKRNWRRLVPLMKRMLISR